MKKRADNLHGSLELLILKSLEQGENHGFGICQHVAISSEGLLAIEEGSLYPALHRLERDKVIAGVWVSTKNGRRARAYTLTLSGRKRLAALKNEWKAVARGVKKVLKFD